MIKCTFKDGKYCENYEDGFCLDRPCEYQDKVPQNLAKADAYSVLADVRADIDELLKSIDEYHEEFSVKELESFSRQKLDAGVKMMRLKNKVSEHFS